MKYEPTLKTELEVLGYKFQYDQGDHEEIKFEVMQKKDIEVTLDHTHKHVAVEFHRYELKGINSTAHLLEFEEKAYGKREM